MPDDQGPYSVAILVTGDTTASVAMGLYDLFCSAGRDWGLCTTGEPGPTLIRPVLVGRATGPLAVCNGATVNVQGTLAETTTGDVVCVPEVFVPPGAPIGGRYAPEAQWLRQRSQSGAIMASACSGALLLGEAGLLAGQDATTHWAYCDALSELYPGVRVHPKQTLVTSGEGQRLIMAGSGASWNNLGLYLISRLVGVEEAMRVARVNLIDWQDIGQSAYASLAHSVRHEDALIADCQVWVATHYHEPAPVAAMLKRTGLTERTFNRRYQQATGMAPLEYVQTLRIEEAKQMLEASNLSVEAIAQELGYEDASFFGRLFRRKVSLTPAQYRRRFGGMRKALSDRLVSASL